MQTGAVIGVTDVHAGALADAFETLEDADRCSRRVATVAELGEVAVGSAIEMGPGKVPCSYHEATGPRKRSGTSRIHSEKSRPSWTCGNRARSRLSRTWPAWVVVMKHCPASVGEVLEQDIRCALASSSRRDVVEQAGSVDRRGSRPSSSSSAVFHASMIARSWPCEAKLRGLAPVEPSTTSSRCGPSGVDRVARSLRRGRGVSSARSPRPTSPAASSGAVWCASATARPVRVIAANAVDEARARARRGSARRARDDRRPPACASCSS